MDPRARKQFISPALLFILLPPLFWAGNFITGRAVHSIVPPMTLSLWRHLAGYSGGFRSWSG